VSGKPRPRPPGSRIGDLRIDALLGQGSSAATYRVSDTRDGASYVLREYLPAGLVERGANDAPTPLDEAARGRFEAGREAFLAEGRELARLDHPNVARVLRVFEADDTAWLLMPWRPGEALHRLLQRSGALDQDEALALAAPLLDALDYLHRQGRVHRDIKPSNVYVAEDGSPILLDLAASGEVALGSPGYAAPEQHAGAGIGPWTDIYGLAATLYRCIGGRLPPPADERARARDGGREDPLAPLAALVAPGRYRAGLLAAIEHGLAVDPRDRPQTVAAWRGEFGRRGAAPTLPAEIEPEGREWLPMILLGVFLTALLAAVVYLFAGGGASGPPAPGAETAAQAGRPSPEEESRWKSALDADVVYGYRQFVQDYPESIHVEQARRHLERLDERAWQVAAGDGSRAALEAYLRDFPEGLHAFDAEIALNELQRAEQAAERSAVEAAQRDDEAWAEARRTGTAAAIDAYLAAWPAGRHAEEARALRGSIEAAANDRRAFEAAARLGSIEAYRAYAEAFPAGRHLAAALEAIDDLTLRPGKTFRDCPDCPLMVVVPAGAFWQGSEESDSLALRSETPRRMVTIAEPFAIGVFEVTFDEWDRCADAGACAQRPPDNGWGRGDRPVMMVSWNDAQEYAAWLGAQTGQSYSLPSESQWEYAARAGEEGDWLGGAPAELCRFANVAGSESGFRWQHPDCADPAPLATLPVGSLAANAFGLHDVIGNVAEWTLDCMNLSYLDAPADGSAWSRGICSSRMTRGGSWVTGTREIRLPSRFNLKNGDRNDFTGLRVVRKVEAP